MPNNKQLNRPAPFSRRGPRGRRPTATSRAGWWIVLAFVIVAAVAGTAIQAGRAQSSTAGAAPHHLLGPANSEIEGVATAPVLVEEYGDYQCPSCGLFHAQTGPVIDQLVKAGTIRFAFHPFAFIGPESVKAAAAAECAGDAGKYFAMWDVLYNNQFPENSGALTTDRLVAFAQQAGVTDPAALQCIRTGMYTGWVQKVTQQGSQRGVNSTPTVFVNGQQLTDRTPQGLLNAVNAAAKGH